MAVNFDPKVRVKNFQADQSPQEVAKATENLESLQSAKKEKQSALDKPSIITSRSITTREENRGLRVEYFSIDRWNTISNIVNNILKIIPNMLIFIWNTHSYAGNLFFGPKVITEVKETPIKQAPKPKEQTPKLPNPPKNTATQKAPKNTQIAPQKPQVTPIAPKESSLLDQAKKVGITLGKGALFLTARTAINNLASFQSPVNDLISFGNLMMLLPISAMASTAPNTKEGLAKIATAGASSAIGMTLTSKALTYGDWAINGSLHGLSTGVNSAVKYLFNTELRSVSWSCLSMPAFVTNIVSENAAPCIPSGLTSKSSTAAIPFLPAIYNKAKYYLFGGLAMKGIWNHTQANQKAIEGLMNPQTQASQATQNPQASTLTPAQKSNAVIETLTKQKTSTQVTKELNISQQDLDQWKQQFFIAGAKVFDLKDQSQLQLNKSVMEVLTKTKTTDQAAKELNMDVATFNDWGQRFIDAGSKAFNVS